jgi:hypothetical protein
MARQNPDDSVSIPLVGNMYLMLKDMTRFKELVETWYGQPQLKTLPEPFQEAVLMFAENDSLYADRFSINPEVKTRFADLRRQILSARRSGQTNSAAGLLSRAFGDTYWYYNLFENI